VKAPRFLTVIAFAAICIALPVGAFGSSAHTAANTQTYTDSTGEDASAPDITSVVVSNDDAGNVTFKINVSNRPTFTSDMAFFLLLNTDNNTATGDAALLGSDYLIELDPGAVGLGKWNGTTFDFSAPQTSLTFSYDATGATIHVSQADLAGTKLLGFAAEAISGIATDASGNPDLTNAHRDLAPDPGHGLFSYTILTKLILKQSAFTTAPNPAKAGARFSASLAATENDTNGPVAGATITCVATLKGKPLRATHTLGNGVASCFWKLPKTAKGLTLHGTITVTKQGTKLVKSFAAKIH
jgi:hypothetical protein